MEHLHTHKFTPSLSIEHILQITYNLATKCTRSTTHKLVMLPSYFVMLLSTSEMSSPSSVTISRVRKKPVGDISG